MRSLVIFAFLSFGSFQLIARTHHGLAPLQEHEALHLESNVHKVIEVTPNAIGAERIQADLGIDSLRISDTEFQTLRASSSNALQMMGIGTALPSSVNNTLLPSFPPIGDQGQIGSCVAWGSTYYQATHEIGLLNGHNNQRDLTHVLSPKWTYDLLNGGVDRGLSVLTAYQLLYTNGAPSIQSFPYDTNYTAWDLHSQDWITAINNRLSNYVLIPGLGGSGPQNLTAIKGALANGHILTFATFIDSWVFTQIKRDPQNINNNHVGEYAATYMNGSNGGHFMTIVGYDDTLWIDVNGNGAIDNGERGAFLIANSWGSSWGNQGLIWISYDAFLAASAVPNGPHIGRIPAGIYLNSCVISVFPKAPNYTPKLIAQFSLSQVDRNQISIQAGISNTNQTTPTTTLLDYAISNQGGSLEFDGSTGSVPETLVCALDLTDLLTQGLSTPIQRYYLNISDNAPGNPTNLNSYTLMDLVRNQQISYPYAPKSYDNSSGYVYLDYDFATGTAPKPVAPAIQLPSFYINVGGHALTSQGQSWTTDSGYVSGNPSTYTNALPFANPIYQTIRYGNMNYHWTLPNGNYNVTLKFSETYFRQKNARIFNVAINGSPVLNQLDIFGAVGFGVPYDLTFPVTITNGTLSIVFSSVVNNAIINGIQITPM